MRRSVRPIIEALRRLWRFGEASQGPLQPSAAGPMQKVWRAWLAQVRLPHAALWPTACMMGPAHSGRHFVARLLVCRARQAAARVWWLGPDRFWAPMPVFGATARGPLLFGRADTWADGTCMLEAILAQRAADLIVWVAPHSDAVPTGIFAARWEAWRTTLHAQNARLLLVAPPAAVRLTCLSGPAWFLHERPWFGAGGL